MLVFLNIFGLIVEIVGVYILGKGILHSRVDELVDRGYVYKQGDAVAFYGAQKIRRALEEKSRQRIGIALMAWGFVFLLIGQIASNVWVIMHASLGLVSLAILVLITLIYSAQNYNDHKKEKFEAAVELLARIYGYQDYSPAGTDDRANSRSMSLVINGVDEVNFDLLNDVIQARRRRVASGQ